MPTVIVDALWAAVTSKITKESRELIPQKLIDRLLVESNFMFILSRNRYARTVSQVSSLKY